MRRAYAKGAFILASYIKEGGSGIYDEEIQKG
jgi:hypothetical protein